MLKIASTGNVKWIPSSFSTHLRMWFVSQDTKKSPAREGLFGDRKTETTEKGAFVSVRAHVLLPLRTGWTDDAYLSITWAQLACRVALDWIFSEGKIQLLLLGLLTQNKTLHMDRFCRSSEYHAIVTQQNGERDRKTPDKRSLFQYLEKCRSAGFWPMPR